MRAFTIIVAITWSLFGFHTAVDAQSKPPLIPHAQDRPPNDPRDPVTAAKMMTVPEGFQVEVVAAEPDIVNPVAMAIDERGRFWITESLEYPRREPGPGRDRVKILEDTDGDGKADRFTVFMEGLNIPSGIAVGHGGIWIANSPDLLFVRDTDGDGQADQQEVVVTGFGRTDTHELPNSLTWGPDGWLYGLNGVFNHSHVRYSTTNPNYTANHPGWPLTCALYRIHPKTREFQVFCEGTSNPWGIAFNDEGDAFVSACVIDHLWHLTESGYYHRQGGPYPAFTWKMESIVKHKHQKAAYCGIHYFDSDSYPEPFRRKLYMGNIHGGCINVDRVESKGATYQGFGEDDFLTANDAWFMPVVQKTGPDGSLYVLDWYDRYHCYQDANRDPAGIDRLKGRLYRVRYQQTPRTSSSFNLSMDSDDQLIERLASKNDFIRDTARRLLQERGTTQIRDKLVEQLSKPSVGGPAPEVRRRMLMTLSGLSLSPNQVIWNQAETDSTIQSWRLRMLGEHGTLAAVFDQLERAVWNRTDLRQQTQAVISAAKVVRQQKEPVDASIIRRLFELDLQALSVAGDDPILSRLVWQNLHPLLEQHGNLFVDQIGDAISRQNAGLMTLMPRLIDRLVGRKEFEPQAIAKIISLLVDQQPEVAAAGFARLSQKVQNREVSIAHQGELKQLIDSRIQSILDGSPSSPVYLPAADLATSWNDARGAQIVQSVFASDKYSLDQRLSALNSLISANTPGLVNLVAQTWDQEATPVALKAQILTSISRLDDDQIAELVLSRYSAMGPELQPRAIELLTQRAKWAKPLLMQVGEKKLPASAINLNQARRLRDLQNEELTKLLAAHWGQSREGRDPNRDKLIGEMRQLIRKTPADPFAGEKAFKKICAQCHKIYNEGADVGPDITLNGRNDFQQLLSNVFDPSLVIGAGYRSYTILTNGGRVLNGLIAEESPQRVVLKVQGGKQEVIARDDIDEMKVNEISLMPEQLERQLSPQEIVDLFAYLSLDKHPSDPSARKLAGSGEAVARQTTDPKEFTQLVNDILPGFSTTASGEGGVAVLKDHFGRAGVLRTHPIDDDIPCVLTANVLVPAGAKSMLYVDVSHDAAGEWRMAIKANGQQLVRTNVTTKSCPGGWNRVKVDLTRFAGQDVKLELMNLPDDRPREFGYWGGVQLITE